MVIFDRYDIVFAEIPNEVSLAFTLMGCPNKCEGCHSLHLRGLNGTELTIDLLKTILDEYKNSITTLLFLGGDAYQDELIPLLKYAKDVGLKTAVYSGMNYFDIDLMSVLDYYKAGFYNPSRGGLKNKNTNQKLIKILGDKIEDITYMFWR